MDIIGRGGSLQNLFGSLFILMMLETLALGVYQKQQKNKEEEEEETIAWVPFVLEVPFVFYREKGDGKLSVLHVILVP